MCLKLHPTFLIIDAYPFYIVVEGLGGGAIVNLAEIITSDLVPLAERPLYQGIVSMVWSLASAIGPPIVRLLHLL